MIGGPDMFVDVGSMVNLSCVVSYTEKPPDEVVWLHNEEEISFRGPRSGVSVSIHLFSCNIKNRLDYILKPFYVILMSRITIYR